MRFGLCVRLGVDLHVRLTEEGRRTHPAPTGGETEMGGTRWKSKKEGDTETEKDKHETMVEKERGQEMKVVGRREGNEALTRTKK